MPFHMSLARGKFTAAQAAQKLRYGATGDFETFTAAQAAQKR